MDTSKIIPAVSTAIFKNGKILIVLRTKGAAKHKWSLPGGHIKSDESPEIAALRELREETGITAQIISKVKNTDIKTTSDRFYRLTVFCGLWTSGTVLASDDAGDANWASRDNLHQYPTTDNLEEIIDEAWQIVEAHTNSKRQ